MAALLHYRSSLRPVILLLLMRSANLRVVLGIGSGDDENPMQRNVWRESRHATIQPEDEATLYGNERHCHPPEPKEANQSHSHQEATWSVLFSRYSLDGGQELDGWVKNQEDHEVTRDERHREHPIDKFIPIMFPIFFAIFLIVMMMAAPLIGLVAFHICTNVFWLFTHPEIKLFGRRILIIKEKMSRKRQRILMAETMKRPPKSRFRLPKFFRIKSDEDLPAELEETDTDADWLAHAVPSDEGEDEKFTDEGASLSGLESEVEVIVAGAESKLEPDANVIKEQIQAMEVDVNKK